MAPEDAVLNFPGWLDHQDTGTQEWVNAYVDQVPAEQRDAAREQFSNMAGVAQAMGADLGEMEQNWELFRDGYAEAQNRPEWDAVMGDEHGFHEMLSKQMRQQKFERYLIQGFDDDGEGSNPNAAAKWQASLMNQAREAAINGKPYTDALSAWQAANAANPGYNVAHADQYAAIAKNEYDRTQDVVMRLQPIADEVSHRVAASRGVEGENGESDMAPYELLRGLTPSEKALVFRLMTNKAGSNAGADKHWWQAAGEGVSRSFENLGMNTQAAAWRNMLLATQFQPGDPVVTSSPKTELWARTAGAGAAGAATPMVPPGALGYLGKHVPWLKDAEDAATHFAGNFTHALTPDEASSWNKQLDDLREDLDTREALRRFGQKVIDPTDKAGNWYFQKIAMPLADNSASIALFWQPELWAPALAVQTLASQNEHYLEYREGDLDPRRSNQMAFVQSALEAPVNLIPFGPLGKVGGRFLPKPTSLAGRWALNAAKHEVAGTATGLLQSDVIPALVRNTMTSDSSLHKEWGEVWSDVADHFNDAALGTLLMAGGFGLRDTLHDRKAARDYVKAMTSDPAAMRLRGYTPEQIGKIRSSSDVGEQMEMLGKWAGQPPPPPGPERDALVRNITDTIQAQRAAFRAKVNIERGVASDAGEYATRMMRDGDGWTVHFGDKTVRVSSAEAADRIRNDLLMAGSRKEAEALVKLIDDWHHNAPENTTRQTTLTGESATSDGKSIQYTRDGQVTREVTDPAALAEIRRQARMGAGNSGNEAIDVAVNGSNLVDFQNKTAEGAGKLAQVLEINHSPSAVLTFLHERVEADYRRALKLGAISHGEVHTAIRELAKHYDPARARTPGERALREQIQKIAAGELDPTALREVMSELAVADVLGRRRDGSQVTPGSISADLFRAGVRAPDAASAQAVGKLRAFLRAVRGNFRALFGTMAALKKARREGNAAGFDEIIRKVTGGDAGAGIKEPNVGEDYGPGFNIGKGNEVKARKDLPTSWDEVKPGHPWDVAKRFLPKTDEKRPFFPARGSWVELVKRVANWLRFNVEAKDPWGDIVKFENPQRRGQFSDPLENRAAHLIGHNTGNEVRVKHAGKLDWIGATRRTIEHAQARVVQNHEILYFRSYKGGVHMVVTEQGKLKNQRLLVTQYAPEPYERFEGALVEKTRPDSGLAAQGGPHTPGLPGQLQAQTAEMPRPGAQKESSTPSPAGKDISDGEGDVVKPPPGKDEPLDEMFDGAPDSLDSYFARLYDPKHIDALRKGLAKFGVTLDTKADQFLAERGIGAAFGRMEDGELFMKLRHGASFREVFHELAHVATYRRLLKEAGGDPEKAWQKYKELGKPRREVEVYEHWEKHPKNWNRLSDDDKVVERRNYDKYKAQLETSN